MIRSMGRATLQRTLDSVARQTWSHIEVIIVNALGQGHPDVGDHCGRYPIRFINNDHPLSRGQAANQALAHAQGDGLMFLDDDDVILPQHVTKLAKALHQSPTTTVLAYTGVLAVDEDGRVITSFEYNVPKGRLFISNYLPIHAVLFKQQLVKQHQCSIDESLDIYEDWDFWLQLSEIGEFVYVPGLSAQYLISDDEAHPVHTPEHIQKAADQIYQKWKPRWHTQGLSALREYLHELESLKLTVNDTELQRHLNKIAELEGALSACHEKLVAQEISLADEQHRLASLMNSWSWKITAPLRYIMMTLRKLSTLFSDHHR
ncbi:hypothetical protein BFW38_16175 [Terasakiispira papahanaumokuakeensis]|uniref:Glycosyltransferase 2-like domain-containing protein n=1 Tax=Terasakiispira papahanaumokuakeensis TaxID=197479 RepID=A0A1E2VCX2_9GAMM|nr:glycosyltransferase [Terasakiispira papahanaumokuakeensis]ODC04837.1 hypothetical protein BFW38_16175 [Terasakiispira papahanaumokuakeensis]